MLEKNVVQCKKKTKHTEGKRESEYRKSRNVFISLHADLIRNPLFRIGRTIILN